MSQARVLVTYAGKRGSTARVGETIAGTMRAEGLLVEIQPISAVKDVDGYESVVIGSGIALHRWRPEAIRFMRRFALHLGVRDVWLFETGPHDDAPWGKPHDMPRRIRKLAAHFGFHGRREHFGEHPDGERVRAWALAIAQDVKEAHHALIG